MTAQRFSVTVAYAAPGVEELIVVTLSVGATVDDAIALAGIVGRLGLDAARLEPAIFGQRVNGRTPLAPGDRIELTRPLVADPKWARRKRAGDHPRLKKNAAQE